MPEVAKLQEVSKATEALLEARYALDKAQAQFDAAIAALGSSEPVKVPRKAKAETRPVPTAAVYTPPAVKKEPTAYGKALETIANSLRAGPLGWSEIIEKTGLAKSTVYAALPGLLQAKTIRKNAETKKYEFCA